MTPTPHDTLHALASAGQPQALAHLAGERYSTILPAGCGAWDVTQYPFGGDFIRPSVDIEVANVRPSHKEGWQLADCTYPNRKGMRTICSNKLKALA